MARSKDAIKLMIGFTAGDNWIGKAIRFFTRQEASHAFMAWDDPNLGRMVMEAAFDGFHIRPWDVALKGTRIVALIEPKGKGADKLLGACARWLGEPYDYPGLLGMTVTMIGRWFKQNWRNPAGGSKPMYCSEAIATGLQEVKYPGAEKLIPSETTPQDLLDFLRQ